MKNIILFGGAFDPIHLGHLNMAKKASEQFKATVFFVPAKISVWKDKSAPVEDKLEMVRLAIKDFGMDDKFIVSDYEAKLESDTNYSIDTVKHFKEMYHDSKIFLLIGGDQVDSFHKWKEADEIAKLAQVIYYGRISYGSSNENIKRFNMKKVHGKEVEASSTEIREGSSLATTDSVIDYMIDHKLYFIHKISSMMNEHRFIHSMSVARLSYEIAKANKLKDAKKAYLAGLLHDIGKEVDEKEQVKIVKEHFPEYSDIQEDLYHQFVGAYLAEKEFGVKDEVVLEAIRFHTTANGNISKVARIVYCADKIEPTRGFDSENLINAMKSSLKDGFVAVMASNIEFYERHGIDYHNRLTNACLEQYYF